MTEPTRDFELTMRLRNNQLKSRRIKLGLTQKQLSKRIGINDATYAQIENMKTSPLLKTPYRDGEQWKPSALKIANFYGCQPDDLWPGAILAATVPEIVVEIGAEKMLAAANAHNLLPPPPPSPDDLVQAIELSGRIDQLLEELTPDEAKVIQLRFGLGENGRPIALGDVGQAVPGPSGKPRSKERIRQIEAHALRKLRSSKTSKRLQPFYDELPGDPVYSPPDPPKTANEVALEYQRRLRYLQKKFDNLASAILRWIRDSDRLLLYKYFLRFREDICKGVALDPTVRGAIIGKQHVDSTATSLLVRSVEEIAEQFSKDCNRSSIYQADVKAGKLLNSADAFDGVMQFENSRSLLVLLRDLHGSELFYVPVYDLFG